MSENQGNGGVIRNTLGSTTVARNGEPTQRFSALQQQLLCAAIHFFHRHIRSDPDVLQRMEGNEMFRLFFEVQYHSNKPDLNRIFPESVHDCSALHVCSFILSILHQGIFSVSAFIVSVIYLSRFKESSHITLHASTWRPLFLTSLLLADKMWEDKPVRNSSLAKLFPVLSNSELNKMESQFLDEIRFNVLVKPDLFCSFCEKLLAEQVHQEITRCVSNSDYAATLQADNVEVAPLKTSKVQEDNTQLYSSAEKVSRPKVQSDKMEVSRHTIGAPVAEDYAPVPRASGRQGQVQSWLESAAPGSTAPSVLTPVVPPTVTPTASGPPGRATTGGETIVPRSQSAGPTTGTGSRRGDSSRVPPGAQSFLVSMRGSNGASAVSNPGGSFNVGNAPSSAIGTPGMQPPKASGASHPPRSISVHPLHRTDSQKKNPIGKAEDQPEKQASVGPPGRTGPVHAGNPLTRSLPVKKPASFQPLARAPSGGNSGITRDINSVSGGGASSTHGGGGSTCTSAAVPRQPPQNSPRSPGGVSPVQPDGVQTSTPSGQTDEASHTPNSTHHTQPQAGRSNSHPRVTSAPAGPGRYTTGNSTASGMSGTARMATPPTPLTSGHMASHTGPAGHQGSGLSKTQTASRGPSSSLGNSVGSGQPTRASSAPRVTGIAAHQTHATPPGSSSVRTAASQPAGQGGPSGHQSRMLGHQMPGSPTLNTSMAQQQFSTTSQFFPNPSRPDEGNSQTMPRHYGGGSSGAGTSGASVVVFPASPSVRGSSPNSALSMVGGTVPMKSGRSTVGSTSGLQRTAMPVGAPAPASPAGQRTMSPAGNMPLGSISVSGNRPDLLSTTRGRSPPPGIAGPTSGASTVRAPRAVTPGQIVKSIQQGTGAVPRGSFGGGAPMVVHRGIA